MPLPDTLAEDARFIENVKGMQRAKLLVEHLSAFEALTLSGGLRGVEPPADQVSNWRRVFCHEYGKTDTPFGIVSPTHGSKRLPTSVCVCNLSGKHAIYYSDGESLAKVICLVAQSANARLIKGVLQVLAKAKESNGAVLACFCLPFQAGIERVHWEIRTIRKTAKGIVKDGELFFSIADNAPKTVPCTSETEHWSVAVLNTVASKLASTASAVCLDKAEGDGGAKRLTMEAMESMLEMLKADRKRTMELHKTTLTETQERLSADVEKAKAKAHEAAQAADARVAKVIASVKMSEETHSKKCKDLEVHNATLMKQLATQQQLVLEKNAEFNGMKLQHEQEVKEYAARQKTLEAQVASMTSSHAKHVAEHSRILKGSKRDYDLKLAGVQVKLDNMSAASRAVQAGASQAHSELERMSKELCEVEALVKATKGSLSNARKQTRVYKAVCVLAGLRASQAKRIEVEQGEVDVLETSHRATVDTLCSFQADREQESEKLIARCKYFETQLHEKASALEGIEKSLADASSKLTEANKEIGRKEHLQNETQKRVDSLERQLKESDAEVKKLTRPDKSPVRNASENASNTVTVSQNTAVFMSPQSVEQPFPSGQFSADPAVENTISHVYSALNCLTAMARSSNANGRRAEVAQAKLDALSAFGQQQVYYDMSHGNGHPVSCYPYGH